MNNNDGSEEQTLQDVSDNIGIEWFEKLFDGATENKEKNFEEEQQIGLERYRENLDKINEMNHEIVSENGAPRVKLIEEQREFIEQQQEEQPKALQTQIHMLDLLILKYLDKRIIRKRYKYK